jgi:ribosomal protein S27E
VLIEEIIMTKNSFVECPHCGDIQSDDHLYKQDDDIYALAPNGDFSTIKCEGCGNEFWVSGGYIPQYETFKTEEEFEERN